MAVKLKNVVPAAMGCLMAAGVLLCSGCAGRYGGYKENHKDDGDNGYYTGAQIEPDQEIYSGDFTKDMSDQGTITKLEVEIGLHSLVVQEGEGQIVSLEAKRADQIQCYVEDGKLYLKEVGRKKIPRRSAKRELILTVPADIRLEEAVMDADMGMIETDRLQAADIALRANMGSIEIEELTADRVVLDSDMGSIEIGELTAAQKAEMNGGMGSISVNRGTAETLKADTAMGALEWKGTVRGDVTASAGMGSITLSLEQKRTDFNYEISAEMGSVELDGRSYGGFSEDKRIDNGANKKMKLDVSMGNIEIYFK